jgi:hypothetical protein
MTRLIVMMAAPILLGGACRDSSDDASSTTNAAPGPTASKSSTGAPAPEPAFVARAGELEEIDVPGGHREALLWLAVKQDTEWQIAYALTPTADGQVATYQTIDPTQIDNTGGLVFAEAAEIRLPRELEPQIVRVCMAPNVADRCVTGEIIPG